MMLPNEGKMAEGRAEQTFAEGLAPEQVVAARPKSRQSSSTNANDWLVMVAADPAFYLSGTDPG